MSNNPIQQLQREDLITVLESAVDLIGIADAEGRTLYVNPATRRVMGFGETEDLLQKRILDYHSPETAKVLIEEAFPIALQQGIWIGETRLRRTDGQEIPTSQVIMTHKNPDGSLKFVSSMMRDITEQKAIEEQLRRSNALLKAQQEASIDGILVADEHRHIVDYNQKFCEIWRLPEVLPAQDSRQIAAMVADQVADPEAFLANIEVLYHNLDEVLHDEILLKDGRTIERHSKAIKSPTGEYYGRITFFRDITERKTAEEALRHSEERYRAFVTATAQAVWMTNGQGEVVEDIPLWCALTGRSEASAKGWGWLESIHPDDRADTAHLWIEAVNSGTVYEVEQRVQVASGEYRLFAVRGVPMFDDQGKIREWIGTQTDITEQKQAEAALIRQNTLLQAQQQALQEKEAQYRSIFEAITDGLFITDLETTNVVEVNPAACQMHGYTYEEFLTLHPSRYIHPDSLPVFQDYIRTMQLGQQFYGEAIDICKDGRLIHIEVKGAICTYNGKPHILAIVRDISERKQAEEALRQSEVTKRAIINAIPDLLLRVRRDGTYLEILTSKHFNVCRVDQLVVGSKVHDSLPQDLADQRLQAIQQALETGELQIYEQQIATNNELHDEEVRIMPSLDDEALIIVRDISDRKAVEAALRRSVEAAEAANRAKSVFLSNMSHELRTPLNAILGFSQLMERDAALSGRQRDSLAIINRSGEHLLNLINDVLEMSKIEAGRATLNIVSFDLHHLLQTLREMFLIRAKAKKLELNFAIAPNLPQYIQTDENKLRQVLINLLSNAMKFTDQGGITLEATVQSELTLQFTVQDTGRGIAPEEFEQLFRPFIQTSSGSQLREGTGLGLTISRRFVQLMGGDIHLESTVGQGATFSFDIQIAIAEPTEVAPSLNSQRVLQLALNQPSYRILIVDDRAENRDFVEQLLTVVGFETRSAVNGADAITQWQQWQPDLILMDMRMPVMDGYEATRQIRSQDQTTKIIALTASAFEEQRASILAAGCNDLVAKPFREAHLFTKLSEHLGVNYVYEVDQEPIPSVSLDRSMLEAMPQDWVSELYQAALAIDAERIMQLIEQIPESNQTLATALRELVEQYEFDQLIDLCQG